MTLSIEEALANISDNQREAGYALGLSRWETVTKIVVPAALPSIITGVVLSAGRIFGEAAALIYTLSPLRPAETLAVHIWKINSEGIMPDAKAVSVGASAVLIIAVLLFNFLARWLGKRLYKHLTAE